MIGVHFFKSKNLNNKLPDTINGIKTGRIRIREGMKVTRLGFEPRTHALKGRCSTS